MWFYCIWIYGEVSSRNFVNVVLLYLDLWRGFVKDFVNVVPLYLDQWRGFVKEFRQCGSIVFGSMERFRQGFRQCGSIVFGSMERFRQGISSMWFRCSWIYGEISYCSCDQCARVAQI